MTDGNQAMNELPRETAAAEPAFPVSAEVLGVAPTAPISAPPKEGDPVLTDPDEWLKAGTPADAAPIAGPQEGGGLGLPNAAASPVAAPLAAPGVGSAAPVAGDATSSLNGASPANTGEVQSQSFEARIEERLVLLERAIVQLPHSIHTVMTEGSQDAETFAKKVFAHLRSFL